MEDITHLRFLFAGVALCAVAFRALLLDAPFTHVKDDPAQLPPPPGRFPRGIEVARIFACPMKKTRRTIALLPGAIRYVSGQSRHFYIEMSGTFDDYMRSFRHKSRSTLKRKVKKYCEAAGVAEPLREFRQPGEMEEFHRLALEVAHKTYQHRLLDAALPASPEYRRDLCRRAAEGRTRGFILMHGEKPAAYAAIHITGGTFTLGKTGFDPAFASCHPGTVMLYLAIQRAFAERRFRLFDFGCGDFAYKEFLATGHTWCGDVLYIERTPRNLAVVAAHHTLNTVTDGVKNFLDVLGLKQRIKKIIHHGL